MDRYYEQKIKEDEQRAKEWFTRREILMDVCETALRNPKFKRDYMYKGNTYCNQGSEWILKQLGYDTHFFYSFWKERQIWIVTTANQIYDKCYEEEREGRLIRIDENNAHALAWQGIPSLLIAKSKDPKRWGHVSVTYPSPPGKELLVCNIGWDNFIGSPHDPKSFAGGKSYLTDTDIWSVPKLLS